MPSFIKYSSTTTGTDTAWTSWTMNTTSTTCTTIDIAWERWNTTSTTSLTSPAWQQSVDDAGRELRAEYERDRAAHEAKRKAKQAEADARAELLLLDNLTEEQARVYRAHKHIILVGGYSGTRYRVRHGRTGNIDVIDTEGRVSHRLCAHPREDMPDADVVLIQKLMIECNEQEFLKVANRHASFDRVTPVLPRIA